MLHCIFCCCQESKCGKLKYYLDQSEKKGEGEKEKKGTENMPSS